MQGNASASQIVLSCPTWLGGDGGLVVMVIGHTV